MKVAARVAAFALPFLWAGWVYAWLTSAAPFGGSAWALPVLGGTLGLALAAGVLCGERRLAFAAGALLPLLMCAAAVAAGTGVTPLEVCYAVVFTEAAGALAAWASAFQTPAYRLLMGKRAEASSSE